MQPEIHKKYNSKFNLEEYIKFENEELEFYEFYDGYLRERDGSSTSHGRISSNITSEIHAFCEGKISEVFGCRMKINIENANAYVYADAFVILEKYQIGKEYEHSITNPAIIIEVLSENTERFDKGEKFRLYKKLPSLRKYILIEQNKAKIDIYSRKKFSSLWDIQTIEGLENNLKLTISETESLIIPLTRIYDRVGFEEDQ